MQTSFFHTTKPPGAVNTSNVSTDSLYLFPGVICNAKQQPVKILNSFNGDTAALLEGLKKKSLNDFSKKCA